MRTQNHAILTNGVTMLADDPALAVRWSELDEQTQGLHPQQNLRRPVRIVTDDQNRATPRHRVVQRPDEARFTHAQEDSHEWPGTVRTLLIPEHEGHLDLVVLMMQLDEQQVNSIWTETGPTLAGVLLQTGSVDELVIYIAPKLLGDDTRGLCTLLGLEKLADTPQFKFKEIRHVDPDVYLHLVGV